MLVAALLPLILWQHLEFLWRHRQRPPSPVANVNRRRPGLAQLYFFVLGILVAQRTTCTPLLYDVHATHDSSWLFFFILSFFYFFFEPAQQCLPMFG